MTDRLAGQPIESGRCPVEHEQGQRDECRSAPGGHQYRHPRSWPFAEFKESVYAIAANLDALIKRAVGGENS
jgi:hypothetical protein